jgi:hypothetical protein
MWHQVTWACIILATAAHPRPARHTGYESRAQRPCGCFVIMMVMLMFGDGKYRGEDRFPRGLAHSRLELRTPLGAVTSNRHQGKQVSRGVDHRPSGALTRPQALCLVTRRCSSPEKSTAKSAPPASPASRGLLSMTSALATLAHRRLDAITPYSGSKTESKEYPSP